MILRGRSYRKLRGIEKIRASDRILYVGPLLGGHVRPSEVGLKARASDYYGIARMLERKKKPTPKLCCPTKDPNKTGLAGCGSKNIIGPDDEGLYDCLNCGLWFNRSEAEKVKT